MIKKIFFIATLIISSLTFGQKAQRIAYIDMEYILENVPEYTQAQSRLNEKVKLWQQKLDGLSTEIDNLNTGLNNEKALLTKEMIIEREEDIIIKQQELKRLQDAYFGAKGDLFRMRKQFVKPVQDQVFNAIQEIAVRKKFDFVFDKSSDLIMLYSNNKFDISELVLNTIVKDRKRKTIEDQKNERISGAKNIEVIDNVAEDAEILTDDEFATDEGVDSTDPEIIKQQEAQKKIDEKEAKRAALKLRIKEQQEAREKLRDSLKKVSEERRAAKLKEIEDRNKQRDEIINDNN
jgi:Skp family chaperone for outer membrane proteins